MFLVFLDKENICKLFCNEELMHNLCKQHFECGECWEGIIACWLGAEILASDPGVNYLPSQASVSSFAETGSTVVTTASYDREGWIC